MSLSHPGFQQEMEQGGHGAHGLRRDSRTLCQVTKSPPTHVGGGTRPPPPPASTPLPRVCPLSADCGVPSPGVPLTPAQGAASRGCREVWARGARPPDGTGAAAAAPGRTGASHAGGSVSAVSRRFPSDVSHVLVELGFGVCRGHRPLARNHAGGRGPTAPVASHRRLLPKLPHACRSPVTALTRTAVWWFPTRRRLCST